MDLRLQDAPINTMFFSQCEDKYSTNLTTNDKSADGVFGTRTWGSRMEGADESAELWRYLKDAKGGPNFVACL